MNRFAVVGAAIASACATPSPAPSWTAQAPPAWLAASVFPRIDALPTHSDPAETLISWRRDDEAWFGVQFRSPGTEQYWLLRFRLAMTPPDEVATLDSTTIRTSTAGDDRGASISFRSFELQLEVTTFDAEGRAVDTTTVPYLANHLAAGFARACAVEHEPAAHDDDVRLSRLRDSLQAIFAMDALLQSIQKIDVFEDILWRVAAKPSFGSLLFNLGASVSVRGEPAQSVPVAVSDAGIPGLDRGWTLPFEIRANDTPAVFGRMIVVEPVPPVLLSGGVLAIEAERAGDAATAIRVQLLAARRGPR